MDGSPHDHKFDRQLRLWGAHGQQALESANVLVLGSGPIASEYVKALVLANVQAFVIMDHALVCMDDLGNNFFLTNDDVGRPRATAVAALLNELNPECSVSSVIRDPSIFIESCRRAPDNEDIQFLRKFNLVLASEIPLQFASHLCDRLYSENIPLLHARSFGLIGALRLALSEHVVVETHPDSDMPDLYLHQSQLARFPALDQFLSTFNVLDPNPDEFQFSHIPFPAILVQLSRKYRSLNPDASVNPSSFKDFISSHDRFKSTNFKEALRYSHYVLRDPKSFISPSLQRILSDPRACSTSKSTHFWILVRALKEFLQNEGQGFFPVSSRLPDMTAETSSYVSIKSIYAEQSLRDRDALSAHARNILRSLELPETYISDFFIDLFAKNCRSIDVSQMASLSRDNGTDCDESVKSVICEALAEEIDGLDAINAGSSDAQIEQPPNDIHWYIALKCADAFYSQNHRYPGDCDDALLEDDIAKLKAIALEIFQSVELGTEHVNVMCLQEIVRFGSSTIHNTAAVVAGIASQESLKLLTNQYVPFNDMCLWNGVHATLARWKM